MVRRMMRKQTHFFFGMSMVKLFIFCYFNDNYQCSDVSLIGGYKIALVSTCEQVEGDTVLRNSFTLSKFEFKRVSLLLISLFLSIIIVVEQLK